MNELTVNGFSALSEEEMMVVDGGLTSEQWIKGSCFVAGAVVGAVIGTAVAGPIGTAVGAKWGSFVSGAVETVISCGVGLLASTIGNALC